jgi:hypothetical protein
VAAVVALPIPGQPYSPNFSERNAFGQKQQQIGYGSGFGLTGGRAIGLAESLPGLAAGAAGSAGAVAPGAGAAASAAAALWSNIGQPELNEAIKSGTQIAATAAMAPLSRRGWAVAKWAPTPWAPRLRRVGRGSCWEV